MDCYPFTMRTSTSCTAGEMSAHLDALLFSFCRSHRDICVHVRVRGREDFALLAPLPHGYPPPNGCLPPHGRPPPHGCPPPVGCPSVTAARHLKAARRPTAALGRPPCRWLPLRGFPQPRRSPSPRRWPPPRRFPPPRSSPPFHRSPPPRCRRGQPAAAAGGTSFGGWSATVATGSRCWRKELPEGREIGSSG